MRSFATVITLVGIALTLTPSNADAGGILRGMLQRRNANVTKVRTVQRGTASYAQAGVFLNVQRGVHSYGAGPTFGAANVQFQRSFSTYQAPAAVYVQPAEVLEFRSFRSSNAGTYCVPQSELVEETIIQKQQTIRRLR